MVQKGQYGARPPHHDHSYESSSRLAAVLPLETADGLMAAACSDNATERQRRHFTTAPRDRSFIVMSCIVTQHLSDSIPHCAQVAANSVSSGKDSEEVPWSVATTDALCNPSHMLQVDIIAISSLSFEVVRLRDGAVAKRASSALKSTSCGGSQATDWRKPR